MARSLPATRKAPDGAGLQHQAHEQGSAGDGAFGPQAQGQSAQTVRSMFDKIAPTYDRLNHVLSAGIDKAWRVELARGLPHGSERILDLCAGTLDLAVAVSKEHHQAEIVAADFSVEMLARGRHKLPSATVIGADALHLPFRDQSFDAVVCGFGVRNVADLEGCFREVRRVLRPGGVFAILEFFRAEKPLTRLFHRLYNQGVLPSVGAMISGDRSAYQYLADSMERFHSLEEARELMERCGYDGVEGRDLIFGIASILTGRRAPDTEPSDAQTGAHADAQPGTEPSDAQAGAAADAQPGTEPASARAGAGAGAQQEPAQ